MEYGRKLVVSALNKYSEDDQIVSGFQYYEIFGPSNKLEEKRTLEINFKPFTDKELRKMIRGTGLQIVEMFGDYSYGSFDPASSSYMIYKMVKK